MPKRITPLGLFHLFVVYIAWGSTFLAVRVAVREGSGFGPFAMAGSRLFTASILLFLIAMLLRRKVRPTLSELKMLFFTTFLIWVGGHGSVVWAEQVLDSGYAALITGTVPIWTAIIEAVLDRRRPSRRLILGILMGFSGIVVLSWPVLQSAGKMNVVAAVVMSFSCISWSFGVVLQARRPVKMGVIASAAWQHLLAVSGFLMLYLVTGEGVPHPQPEAWVGWGYLIVVGSLLAFTSYIAALKMLPTPVVMTHGYVNPVVAVFLGWLILNEPLTHWTFAGTALVLLGIGGVFREKSVQSRQEINKAKE